MDLEGFLSKLALSQVADWWEEQRRQTSGLVRKSLDQYIEENPSMFRVVVATTAQTAVDFPMALGAGFVDTLNLGKGAAEGGWGYVQDGLRFVSLAAPLASQGRALLSRVILVDGALPNCTWVAATKALRLTGTRCFAVVEDLVRAAGLNNIQETGGAFVDRMMPYLQQLGARVRPLATPASMNDVIQAARANRDGVVMFSVEWFKGGHTLLASYNPFRGVLIADRSGAVVGSLRELERYYEGISGATPYGTMAVVDAARVVKATNTGGVLSLLALQVKAVFVPPPKAKTASR
jgi:hypothetical protein